MFIERDGALVDVAVLGAGPAGAACALSLMRAGVVRICLIDSGCAPGSTAVGETIPPDARLLLDRLGLWQAFLAEGHEACLGSCSSWGSEALGFNDFLLNPHGSGWHLDRARFDDFLRHHASAAGVMLLDQGRFLDAEAGREGGYRLRIGVRDDETRTVCARFVVDATGRASAFARHAGARRLDLDRLTFLYGYFDTAGAPSHSRLTLLEAERQGWWYAAALPGKRLAVAFATDADTVHAGDLARDAPWLRAALTTRHLAQRLDGCRFLAGSVTARAASSFLLDRVAGPHWLAVGDAAACFDPLAAQGIYKAIADGIEAAALIVDALGRSQDVADRHDAAVRARFDEYLVNRNYFYNIEQRWPDSPFWQRRHSRLELMATA